MKTTPVQGWTKYLAAGIALFEVVEDDLMPIKPIGIQVITGIILPEHCTRYVFYARDYCFPTRSAPPSYLLSSDSSVPVVASSNFCFLPCFVFSFSFSLSHARQTRAPQGLEYTGPDILPLETIATIGTVCRCRCVLMRVCFSRQLSRHLAVV